MVPESGSGLSGSQTDFHARWHTLQDAHVRALAWLLDSPDLLDARSPRWQGRIVTLGDAGSAQADWLHSLDREPASLHTFLDLQPLTRLGRYAEKLLAWYFLHMGQLRSHGLQVRDPVEGTLGEFDFLLNLPQGLEHWEMATKFYLLRPQADRDDQAEGDSDRPDRPDRPDYFIGPNLADTLGAKMKKILDRQLSLGQRPAARALLDAPLVAARALIKGWLFYRRDALIDGEALGVSASHCRGWWCRIDELDTHLAKASVILPRLSWLAPARVPVEAASTANEARARITHRLAESDMPVMIANLSCIDGVAIETDRGFVVPLDWATRARSARR